MSKTLNYCFPPEPMIAQLLNHLRACRAKCAVIIPRVCMPWFSTLSEGLVRQERIARKGQAGVFVWFHKNKLAPYRPKHDMMAALVDFEWLMYLNVKWLYFHATFMSFQGSRIKNPWYGFKDKVYTFMYVLYVDILGGLQNDAFWLVNQHSVHWTGLSFK